MTPPAKTGEEKPKKTGSRVTVTNTYRSRPVMFHARGAAIRLGPTESKELDEHCLSSPELSKLVRRGAVTVKSGKKAARPAETPDEDKDEAGEQAERAKRDERGRRPS